MQDPAEGPEREDPHGQQPQPEDLARIEHVISVVGDGARLAVDANGALGEDAVFEFMDALAPYGLGWIEEPVDPLDFELLGDVAS